MTTNESKPIENEPPFLTCRAEGLWVSKTIHSHIYLIHCLVLLKFFLFFFFISGFQGRIGKIYLEMKVMLNKRY